MVTPSERSDKWNDAQAPESLKRSSVQGSAATLTAQGAIMVIGTLTTMVLARLLTPGDFGLIAMAAIVMNLAVLFQNIGLDTATIRAIRVTHEQVSALFWINLATGAILMTLVMACAPLVAAFFNRPGLTMVVAALAPSFLCSGAMLQHQALLRRRMLFARLALATVSAQVIASLAAIATAAVCHSYWALVVLRLVQSLAFAAAVWAVCPWQPSRPARAAGLRPMLAFGCNLTGSRVVQFVMRNADNLLIGKFIGQGALGFYDRAYALLLLPIRQLNVPFSTVVTPGLAKVVNDPPRFVAYYTRALNAMTFLSMPLVVLCTLTAPEIVGIVLGPGWDLSLSVFLCLAPAAFMGSFNMATSWVYVAVGRADREFRMSAATAVVGVSAMVLGLRWGVLGMACSISVVTVLFRPVQIMYCFHGTAVRMRDFALAIVRPASASLAAGLAAFLLAWALPDAPNLLVSAVVKAGFFAGLYLGIYLLLPGGRSELARCMDALRELKPRRQRANEASEKDPA